MRTDLVEFSVVLPSGFKLEGYLTPEVAREFYKHAVKEGKKIEIVAERDNPERFKEIHG